MGAVGNCTDGVRLVGVNNLKGYPHLASMSDDTALLSLYAQARDPEAFRRIIDRHAGLVFGTCLRICGNRSDADDAVQEVFIELARAAGRIRGSLPAWLHTVSQRSSWRILRRRGHTLAHEPVAAQPDAVRALLPYLDAAIAALPDDERQCIVLRYLEGHTQAEIAAELGLSQPTVHRRLCAATVRLRERLSATDTACAAVLLAAQSPVPPEVQASLGKVALIGPAPATGVAMGWLVAAGVVLAASMAITTAVFLRDQPPPAAVAGENPPPLPPPPAPAAPQHLATVVVRDLPIAQAITLAGQQSGARVELHPALAGDPTRITLACEQMPAEAIVRQLVAQVQGWRVRLVGGVLVIDRGAAPGVVQQVTSSLVQPDAAAWTAAARQAIDSGDWELAAVLAAALANPALDHQPPATVQACQVAVLHGLGELGATQQTWLWCRRGTEALTDNVSARDGIVAALLRCRRLAVPPTPLLVHLAGLWHATAASPLLAELANDPWPWFPGWDRAGAFQSGYIERCRQSARWSLAQLGTLPTPDDLARSLRSGNDMERLTALRLLAIRGDVGLVREQMSQKDPVWMFNAERHIAAARWLPDQLARQTTGTFWDLGDVCGTNPTVPLLRALLGLPPRQQSWWFITSAILEGSGRMAPDDIRTACNGGGRLNALLAATAGDTSRLADIDKPGELPPDLAGPLLTRLPGAVRTRIHTQIAWPEVIPAASDIATNDDAWVAWFYDPLHARAVADRLRGHGPSPAVWWRIRAIDWDRNPCPQLTPTVLDGCTAILNADDTPAETRRVMAIALMGRVAPFDTGDAALRLIMAIIHVAQTTHDEGIQRMITQWRSAPSRVNDWERIYEQAVLRGRWDDQRQLARWDSIPGLHDPESTPVPVPDPF